MMLLLSSIFRCRQGVPCPRLSWACFPVEAPHGHASVDHGTRRVQPKTEFAKIAKTAKIETTFEILPENSVETQREAA